MLQLQSNKTVAVSEHVSLCNKKTDGRSLLSWWNPILCTQNLARPFSQEKETVPTA
jgi:hypothetical protein